jgi:hypothetical protein
MYLYDFCDQMNTSYTPAFRALLTHVQYGTKISPHVYLQARNDLHGLGGVLGMTVITRQGEVIGAPLCPRGLS